MRAELDMNWIWGGHGMKEELDMGWGITRHEEDMG